jgi:hypothetical protein
MKRQRKLYGIILSGLFLTYFSASVIFVPNAPGLKDQDATIIKFENHDEILTHGLIRSSSEQVEDGVKFFDEFVTISFVANFHTTSQQNALEHLESIQFREYDLYLSMRRLQI